MINTLMNTPTETRMDPIERRLARLERSNRLWACTALCLLSALGAMGLAKDDESPRELTLDRLVIGTQEGAPRMVLEQGENHAMLRIAHPDNELDDVGSAMLNLSANEIGGMLKIGYTMLQGRHDGSGQVFQMGNWLMADNRLTLGPMDQPTVMLGHRDSLGLLQLADHEGRIRAEMRILEPWDTPGETSGYLQLHSPGDTLTLRVNKDSSPAETGDE